MGGFSRVNWIRMFHKGHYSKHSEFEYEDSRQFMHLLKRPCIFCRQIISIWYGVVSGTNISTYTLCSWGVGKSNLQWSMSLHKEIGEVLYAPINFERNAWNQFTLHSVQLSDDGCQIGELSQVREASLLLTPYNTICDVISE